VARMDEKRREMILKGDLLKTIIIICMPLALYQFFNSCYNLLDQIICAQICIIVYILRQKMTMKLFLIL